MFPRLFEDRVKNEYKRYLIILYTYLKDGDLEIYYTLDNLRNQLEQAKKDLYVSQFSISSSNGEEVNINKSNFKELIDNLCSQLEKLPIFAGTGGTINLLRTQLINFFTKLFEYERERKTFPQPDKAIDEVEYVIASLVGTNGIEENLSALDSLDKEISENYNFFAFVLACQLLIYSFSPLRDAYFYLFYITTITIQVLLSLATAPHYSAEIALRLEITNHLKSLRSINPAPNQLWLRATQNQEQEHEQEP